MAVKVGSLPTPAQGSVWLPTSGCSWILSHGWPYSPPFLPRHVAALCSHGCVFLCVCPRDHRGREEHTGAWDGEEPEACKDSGEGTEKARLFEVQTFEGPHCLCCEPCQGDLWQSAVSPWQCAMGIQGGDRSWRGAPWSATCHNFPWRSPRCALCHSDVRGDPHHSDLFSQRCGWVCSVPSALSHWPPRPAICLQAVRQLAGVRGTLCDHGKQRPLPPTRTLGPSPRSPCSPG